MKKVILFLLSFMPAIALADTCPDGYTEQENGDCTITCAAGYQVANPGELCTGLKAATPYYVPNAHTVKYGETSAPYLKKCPATGDGRWTRIAVARATSISMCVANHSPVRYDASDRGNCIANPSWPDSCMFESHGNLVAECYYTTGEDGSAIYDKRTTDPVTGEERNKCVGGSDILSCDAGYYAIVTGTGGAPGQFPCTPVGTEYYSPDGDLERYACPENTATCGYGECAKSIDDCKPYKTLKTSSGISVILQPEKHSAPALAVRMPDGKIWYGAMDAGARDGHVNITYNSTPYAVINPMDIFIEMTTYGHTLTVTKKP